MTGSDTPASVSFTGTATPVVRSISYISRSLDANAVDRLNADTARLTSGTGTLCLTVNFSGSSSQTSCVSVAVTTNPFADGASHPQRTSSSTFACSFRSGNDTRRTTPVGSSVYRHVPLASPQNRQPSALPGSLTRLTPRSRGGASSSPAGRAPGGRGRITPLGSGGAPPGAGSGGGTNRRTGGDFATLAGGG